MEEQREVGERNMPPVPITLNYKCRRQTSTLEDSKDYFQVVPVPSYAPNLHANTSRKLSRMKDNERRKTSLNKIDTGLIKLTNENQKRQKSSSSSPHGKTSPPSPAWRAKSTDNTNDLSDWLLLGKSIQDPGCSSAKKDQRNIGNEFYFLPRKEEESGKNHFCSGLHTYPPSIAKCSDPEHLRKTNYSENKNYSAEKDRLHHWYPSFSSRPLGEPCTTNYSGWQKLRNKTNVGGDKKLDEIIAAGRQAQFSQRKTASHLSLRNSSSAQLLRSSSSSSLTKYTSRSRSISLPTQGLTSLHHNVVFDWEEKRNNGITYVTPLFQTSEPERLSVGLSADYDNEPSCAEHEVKMDNSYSEDLSLKHDELRKL